MKLVGKTENWRKSYFCTRADCSRVSKHRKDNTKSQLGDRIIRLHFHHVRRLISRGRVNERSRNWLLCPIIYSQYLRAARIFIVLSVYFREQRSSVQSDPCVYIYIYTATDFVTKGKFAHPSADRIHTTNSAVCVAKSEFPTQECKCVNKNVDAISLKRNILFVKKNR